MQTTTQAAKVRRDLDQLAEIVPSFLRRWLDRCEAMKLPESVCDDGWKIVLESVLGTGQADDGSDGWLAMSEAGDD